jgi:hypothetical protein
MFILKKNITYHYLQRYRKMSNYAYKRQKIDRQR